MKYALIIEGTVSQIQYAPQRGFIEVPDDATCGMRYDGQFLYPPLKAISQVKTAKLKEIEDDFIDAEATPIDYNNFKFVGGYDSVMSIDAYVRLTILGEGGVFTIWDVNGTEHDFTEVEVSGLILAIGSQASINKFTKKNRKVALFKAETIDEVSAV